LVRRSAILDRNSPIPLYHQISEAILHSIRKGQLKPGDTIPTEQELIKSYSVSRITVRRALQELEKGGYLIRKQGLGTYVAPSGVRRGAMQLSSFTEETASWGMKPKSKLLALRQEPAPDFIAERFEIPSGQQICYVERLRIADDLIIALTISYLNLPPEIELNPERFEETGSLWAILEHDGLIIADVDRTIGAISADEFHTNLLEVELNDPLLSVESLVYSSTGSLIEISQIIGRGDRYKFNFRYNR